MTAYLIVDSKINDEEAYENYKIRAKLIVESYGREYLARGGYTKCKRMNFGLQLDL